MPTVPAGLDGGRWEDVEPYVKELLARPVADAAGLEAWLLDRSELDAACREAKAVLYINMSCDTESGAHQKAYTAFVSEVEPKLKPASFELDKRQEELTRKVGLLSEAARKRRYEVLARDCEAEVKLFREENVALETELSLLAQKYEQVSGAMTVVFEGKEQTLPQMARYQESTDRAVREGAWRAVAERRLRDRAEIDGVYDEMIALRSRVAVNAGFRDYVGYAFSAMHRFDYGPAECARFHEGVEKAVVPLVRAIDARRAAALAKHEGRVGNDYRPWDVSVDVKGRAPLRPFEGGRDLVRKTVAVFDRLDARLGAMVRELGDGSNTKGAAGGECLDLDSRKGKAPGGYQYMRDRSRRPFIFMNAAGVHRDAATMLHEAGHAFHSMVCRDEPLVAYRGSPTEFAEVASMSMELLTMGHWGVRGGFYEDSADLARAQRRQLEDSITLLPWIATLDAFQHWVYTNAGHTSEARREQWLRLDRRFGRAVDWAGLEESREWSWQRVIHLFGYPMYYIEYGIAQLGALQLWLHAKEKGESAAVEMYLKGLRLGGSRPLPELFEAAGLKFDFGPEVVKRLADRVQGELERLPD